MRSIAEIREMGRRIVDDAILSDWRRRTGQSYSLRIERVADSCTNLQEPAGVGNPRRVRFWVDDGTVIDEIPSATAPEHVSDTRFRIEILIDDDVLGVSLEDTTIALDYEGSGEDDPWDPFEERWASQQFDRDVPDVIGRAIAWLGDNLDRLIDQNL